MFYEVYIDVFFAVNALLDYVVLRIVCRLGHYRSRWWRLAVAAMAGSAVLCLFLCIPGRKNGIVRALFYVAAYAIMAATAYAGLKWKGFLRAMLSLYVVSLLVNGIFHWLGMVFDHVLALSAGCAAVCAGAEAVAACYKYTRGKEQNIYEVCIVYRHQSIWLKGLWDTGNRLRSPYHQKGVSVVSYESLRDYLPAAVAAYVEGAPAQELYDGTVRGGIYFVPYETVNERHGVLPVIEAEQMVIRKEEGEVELAKPLLGLSRLPVSGKNAFQVILTTLG